MRVLVCSLPHVILIVLSCVRRSFHASNMGKHKSLWNWKGAQPCGQDHCRGQLSSGGQHHRAIQVQHFAAAAGLRQHSHISAAAQVEGPGGGRDAGDAIRHILLLHGELRRRSIV